MTYQISNDELGCMLREVRNTSPSISTFTMSLQQARSLIEEVYRERNQAPENARNRHIDVFDLSSGTMGVWGGYEDTD